MANILYLVHRLPYPPNKGDKVRSYHLLRHLQKSHRVFLGTFIDDPDDEAHVDALSAICPDVHIERLHPRWAKLCSLRGLLSGQALSVAFYRHPGMRRWVDSVVSGNDLQASIVFSGAMAQFATPLRRRVPMLVDFVDVDSAKWSQYAPAHRWPMSWLYRREGTQLLQYEREVAQQALRSFFVTPKEVELFASRAPEAAPSVQALGNGVDADYFSPDPAHADPYPACGSAVVFTGAMDYWPNVDGVSWFVAEILPLLLQHRPGLRFYIVGRNPAPEVKALASGSVIVTGTVPDVRPYLQHADAVVAPLRVARGIQNKILEAMAMGKPVVTVPGCADAIGAGPEQGLLRATSPQEFAHALQGLLESPDRRAAQGSAARDFVLQGHSWQAQLSDIDAWVAHARHPEHGVRP